MCAFRPSNQLHKDRTGTYLIIRPRWQLELHELQSTQTFKIHLSFPFIIQFINIELNPASVVLVQKSCRSTTLTLYSCIFRTKLIKKFRTWKHML